MKDAGWFACTSIILLYKIQETLLYIRLKQGVRLIEQTPVNGGTLHYNISYGIFKARIEMTHDKIYVIKLQ